MIDKSKLLPFNDYMHLLQITMDPNTITKTGKVGGAASGAERAKKFRSKNPGKVKLHLSLDPNPVNVCFSRSSVANPTNSNIYI